MTPDTIDQGVVGDFPVDEIRGRMLAWFDRNKRPMPWRAERPDPYHVLVSEAMLQQTQVATVIPYFTRFIQAFASARELAAAPEEQVMKLWQGLGYYRRARNLQAAAKAIVARHDGRVPGTVEELLALPGIGPYTAGAVASIGFGVQTPLVDGNVIRVLTRWFAIESSTDRPQTQKLLWRLAGLLVPSDRPGDFNQSLMELGATCCSVVAPKCLHCPAAEACRARALNREEDFPVRERRKKPLTVVHDLVFVRQGRAYLFRKRPDDGLWAGLYQCPTIEHEPTQGKARSASESRASGKVSGRVSAGPPGKAQLAGLAPQMAELGVDIASVRWVGSFKHQTTHRDITFRVFEAEPAKPGPQGHEDQPGALAANEATEVWRTLEEAASLPFSVAQHKAIGLLRALPDVS